MGRAEPLCFLLHVADRAFFGGTKNLRPILLASETLTALLRAPLFTGLIAFRRWNLRTFLCRDYASRFFGELGYSS